MELESSRRNADRMELGSSRRNTDRMELGNRLRGGGPECPDWRSPAETKPEWVK
jgi:hypothetical protein